MSKKFNPEISEEDIQLFRKAIKKIQPIKCDKVLLKNKPARRRYQICETKDKELEPYLSDNIEHYVLPDQVLFFAKSGLSTKQTRKLKQGKYPIMATLDLHGFSAQNARIALINFVNEASKRNRRCISVIHGKGHTDKPVLKNNINHWLKQLDNVLAFCTALPKHGGTGALYVLLRSSK